MQRLFLLAQHLSPETIEHQINIVDLEVLENEAIGILYLNSPTDMNFLSMRMSKSIADGLDQLDNDDRVKVIIILSKLEKVFCGGAQVNELKNLSLESQIIKNVIGDSSEIVQHIKKPIIGGINGLALGGGMELAMLCDIIIASDNAKLALPELKLGLIPGVGGSQLLSRLVGRTNAMKYLLTSDIMSAEDAKRLGIVNLIVKKEDLKEECMKMARKVANKSLATLILAKSAIKYAEEMPLTVGMRVERQLFDSLLNTKGGREGLAAFVEKRKPNFKDM